MKFKYPHLVCSNMKKPVTRESAYPYVLASTLGILVVLVMVMKVLEG